ncbi:MAG: OmpA family protein [Planctomycetota bacterium]|nr:OmpA family protein [Planctomycetota bacterium]
MSALFAVLTMSSCASQQEVQDAYDLAKRYEREKYDLAAINARLLSQNGELEAQLREQLINGLDGNPVNAAWRDRLDELQGAIGALNRPLQDVERFDVEGGYVVMVQDKILFESGKAELAQEGRTALAEIAQQIKATTHKTIFVRGHTDSDPVKKPATLERFPHGNIQLSAERAVAVAALLIETEPTLENDVRVMGFGPHDPLKKNDSAANKRLNRRVEIFVQD